MVVAQLVRAVDCGSTGRGFESRHPPQMTPDKISSGTVHDVPKDLRKALTSSSGVRAAWEDLTPIARNEWICWVESVKKAETRTDHVKRVPIELLEGKRRPCCWYGCIHRTDKAVSPSVQSIVNRRVKSKSVK